MRVAVTGGTGFVGTHVTSALRAAGHDVVVLARGQRRKPRRRTGVTFVRADASIGDKLEEAFAGCDAVIHLVAVIREKKRQTFDRVNRQGTENVVAAAKSAGVRHFVHLSGLGADPDPAFPYLASKWAGEQAVIRSGMPYTILRSSLIFGLGDDFFTRLAKLIRISPIAPIAGSGRTLFQPISVADVARCFLRVLENDPGNQIVEIGGPEQMSYDELVDAIKSSTGMHRLKVHIPVPFILPAAFVMEKVLPNPPVTPGQLKLLAKNNITQPDAVKRTYGFVPVRFADSSDYLNDY